MVAAYPAPDPALPENFLANYGVRMVEAALRAAELEDLEVEVIDALEHDADAIVARVERFDPDVIGLSAYIWSFPTLVEVARALKSSDPERVVVFGGPAARPAMLEQLPFRDCVHFVDALVIGEGEVTFVELVRARDRRSAALSEIAGLALPDRDAGTWCLTASRPSVEDLDALASPYCMGLVPPGGLGYVQSYRGCPFRCSFCEWGVLESPRRVRSAESLSEDLIAMTERGAIGALCVDAGLNLNTHGFESLREAARRTGVLRDRVLVCELYPAKVRDEHLAFLSSVGSASIGVGLQSFDERVLENVERRFDAKRFDERVRELASIGSVSLEIILGLPGDHPDNFRRSFERARALPASLRVYHCVVLPSALMVRAPASFEMIYDPVTLKLQSCLGWRAEDLERARAFLNDRAEHEGGGAGEYFWSFPMPTERRAATRAAS